MMNFKLTHFLNYIIILILHHLPRYLSYIHFKVFNFLDTFFIQYQDHFQLPHITLNIH